MKQKPVLTVILFIVFGILFAACRIHFVSMPNSADMDETITARMDVLMEDVDESLSDSVRTLYAGGAFPVGWSVDSVMYAGTVHGIAVTGTAVLDLEVSEFMDDEFETTGYAWQMYAVLETVFAANDRTSATFQVQVGSAGAFTVLYAAIVSPWDSIDTEFTLTMAHRRIVVEGEADPLDAWERASLAATQFSMLFGITHGDGAYVAVGGDLNTEQDPLLLTSTDGEAWQAVEVPGSDILNDVAWGDGVFVAVGDDGTVLRSADSGATWGTVSSGTGENIRSVTYGDGVFVATAANTRILTSTDGTSWTEVNPGLSGMFYSIAFGNGRFVAVGDAPYIIVSGDQGATWETIPAGDPDLDINDVAWGDGFMAVGDDLTVFTSPDGLAWSESTINDNLLQIAIPYDLQTVAWGGDRWLVFGTLTEESKGGPPPAILGLATAFSSEDGEDWEVHFPGTAAVLIGDSLWADDYFYVVGWNNLIIRTAYEESGGGGGGCSTGKAEKQQVYSDVLWISLLFGASYLYRRRRSYS